ncbi:MAG: alcohol dehydrogenase catalytic domain-containing protein [Methylocella sp.]
MALRKLGIALEWTDLADRQPGPGEIRVKVAACGVCRKDLHVVDGELPGRKVPITLATRSSAGSMRLGPGSRGPALGERAGTSAWDRRNLRHYANFASRKLSF